MPLDAPELRTGNVVLLCHFDGTNGSTSFTDNSLLAHTLTATSTTVNTTAPKFGTGSGDFTASSAAYIDTGNSTDFHLGSGQFTLETWAYFTSTPSLNAMMSQWDSGSNNGWWFGYNTPQITFFLSTTGVDASSLVATYAPTLNTWIHIAIDYDATNTFRLYVNGAVVASSSGAVNIFPSTRNCRIGNDYAGSRGFPGHLDEMRITVGLAQYAGAFTPAAAPFPNPGVTTPAVQAMVLA